MCSAVRNVCDSHQRFDLMELIVALLCISDSAAHVRGPLNLAETCNFPFQPHLRSIEACTSVCDWHQCFDLAELVVTLFFIFNSAAHIRGLSSFTYLCNGPGRPHLQIIGACISVHDQYRPSSLFFIPDHGGRGIRRMLAELQNGARFSEYAVSLLASIRVYCDIQD
jgi:hypothetical protein